ncbi:20S-pre-rRNA D-site endonuclease nob1 [Leucoagaricus sp. SymC.cos]|nr:20S-pre-rRNA D-site endonuclease nob1 [Leucoagaricus sp. SymC.cos]
MTEQSQPNPKCRNLVLDAGPILSLSPLRGLASMYYTTPQVLAELKDSRAREHFEKLGLMSGVNVAVKSPDATSLANVIQWAKKTGDYSVLSHADLCVIALTYMLNEEYKREVEKEAKEKEVEKETEAKQNESAPISEDLAQQVENLTINTSETDDKPAVGQPSAGKEATTKAPTENDEPVDSEQLEPLQVELHPIKDEESSSPRPINELIPDTSSGPDSDTPSGPQQLYDDPSSEDDGEGEWITPQNVGIHKSRALDFLPDDEAPGKKKGKGKAEEPKEIGAGCMTADFSMQNVLLQMGLDLVSVDGKRIQKVKNYVLRCHACFKICKDHSKKFCPSCGNPSLLRATVTISAPNAAKDAPVLRVHLKPNFQYRIRGTKYSIPASKPGSAKTGTGEGLILREDQTEWMRAKKRADGKREREEARMLKGMLNKGVEGANGGVSSWMDPDWVPEILSVGSGGKGRTVRNSRMDGDMPIIGFGKKNPNERKKRK